MEEDIYIQNKTYQYDEQKLTLLYHLIQIFYNGIHPKLLLDLCLMVRYYNKKGDANPYYMGKLDDNPMYNDYKL